MSANNGGGAPSQARMQLDRFKSIMQNQGIIITPGYIRDDFPLSNNTAALTTSVIQWQITAVATSAAPAQAKRLTVNDAFLVTDIGFYWGFTPTTGGAISTAIQQAQSILHTFPESGVLQAADLLPVQELYNGFISIKESSTTYFEQLECYGFYRVPVQQQGLIFATGGSTGNRSGWDKMNYGMKPITPQFQIAGNRTYITNLNLPGGQSATFGALSGTNGQLWATIRFGGFLATGGARFV